ncbi:MAG: glycoside hydrolase family 5 protein [Eubacteriales bacterium]|nr:glycoside hydrolase family 5 protein [Eubacteriales bacterium]
MKKIVRGIVMMLACLLFFGQAAEAKTELEKNGALKVSGTQLVSQKTGKKVQLRGVSTHGINWDVGYPYISKDAFKTLRDDYGVNAIRLAMYTTEYYGYCDKAGAWESQSEVQKVLKTRIHTGVQAATDLGMYVIIDWHVLNDQNPNKYKKEAKAFFKEMSKKYASYDNVLYEICNEPNGGTQWSDIKNYAKEVIPVIRENDKDAVVIVGTPTWSQDVDIVSQSPLDSSYGNVMYTLHFYSATHKDWYRQKLETAYKNGLPVMVTEFGVSEASGSGQMDTNEAQTWLNTLDKKGISYFAWSLSNKPETASLLASGTSKKSGWKTSDLSPAGKWILGKYKQKAGIKFSAVTNLSIKNKKGKVIYVTFSKKKDAAGYEIAVSTSSKFAKGKTKTIKTTKNTYTVKKCKKNQMYYVRVRAYKKVNGKKVYSNYSAKKKIKIAK